MILSNEFITIRKPVKEDASTIFRWKIDKEIYKYDPRPLPQTTIELEKECQSFVAFFDKYILEKNDKYIHFIVEDKQGILIGVINLFSFNNERTRAELGIIIGNKSYWNRGIVTTSLNHVLDHLKTNTKLKTVVAEIQQDNLGALKLFNKIGFSFETNPCQVDEDGFVVLVKSLSNS